MCVVSMVGDFYDDKWKGQPWYPPTTSVTPSVRIVVPPPITREEFDALKREVQDMKELLKRAKEYDERNGEPDCEIDEKMEKLRKVAELVGVSLDDVLKHSGT